MLQRIAAIFTLALLASCGWNTGPGNGGSPQGLAHIMYEGQSYDVTGVYGGGFHILASFGTYPSSHNINIFIDSFSHTGRYLCSSSNNGAFVSMSADVSPFNYASDSGEVTVSRMNLDSTIGSFSVRLRGYDSSYRRLSGSFIASSHLPLD